MIGGYVGWTRDMVRRHTSMSTRRRIAMGRVALRRIGARERLLPDLLIIGAQRGGTSSLYRYLGAHPDVVASLRKETKYFSTEFHRGELWYRAHFPWHLGSSAAPLTFEATPAYLLHPLAAERASRLLPTAKIVAMLRDPVERAFSQYKHNRRLGLEHLTFEEALGAEPERLDGEFARIDEDPMYPALPLRRYGYVERGKYAEQLERWLAQFEAVHVVRSEDFMDDPTTVFRAVLEFIELAPWEPDSFPNYSYGEGQPRSPQSMPPNLRQALQSEFEPWNARLSQLLGRDLVWSS